MFGFRSSNKIVAAVDIVVNDIFTVVYCSSLMWNYNKYVKCKFSISNSYTIEVKDSDCVSYHLLLMLTFMWHTIFVTLMITYKTNSKPLLYIKLYERMKLDIKQIQIFDSIFE